MLLSNLSWLLPRRPRLGPSLALAAGLLLIPRAQGSLEAYDDRIAEDAAGGLVPLARLTRTLPLPGPSPAAFDFGPTTGDTTIEFIVAGDPTATSAYLAVGANVTSNLRFAQWPGTGQLGFTQLGVEDYRFSPGVASPVQAAHLAFVWTAANRTMRLYRDGVLAGSAAGVDSAFAMPAGAGWLGANPNGTEAMTGTLDRVTVYRGAVAEEVVRAHADAFRDIIRPPVIGSFAATPESVFTPGVSTLRWEVTGATALFLDGREVTGQTTLTVVPAVTTTYTLVATHRGASAQAQVTVRVNPPPTIQRFTAPSTHLTAGDPLTLDWQVRDALSLRIDPDLGDVTDRTVQGVGTVTIEAPAASRYTLTATSPFGVATQSLDLHLHPPIAHLVINEFMADDEAVLADEDGEHSGWIEIFNPTPAAIDLAGHYLTDDPADPFRWSLPATNLAARTFLVVFASGKNRTAPGAPWHTNFRLANGGEFLALAGPGPVWLHAFHPAFPRQRPGLSYGLLAGDPATARFLGSPTPGMRNDGQPPPPEPVMVGTSSRTFLEPFAVVLTAPEAAAVIRYTLDGSAPSLTHGTTYAQPVTISQSTRLRAVAVLDGRTSALAGACYLRLGPDLAQYRSTLPLMVIDNFGAGTIPQKGWSGSGAGLRQVPRQPAAWGFFDRVDGRSSLTGSPQMLSIAGIRGRGAYSTEWRQKPYSVEAVDEAGAEVKVSPLGLPAHADWVLYFPDPDPSRDPTLLFNTFAYELSRRMDRYAVRFRWVEAFINEDGGDLTLADRRGVYAVIERVARGEQRLAFAKLSADGATGGWLLNINRMDPEPETGWPTPNGAVSPWFFHTAGPDRIAQALPNTSYSTVPGDDQPQQWNAYFNFDNPNGYVITAPQRAAVEGWFRQFEDVLYDDDVWRHPTAGYRRYLDTGEFIDYFLLNTLTRNGDGLLISMYPWKGDDNRLRIGPAWDYNWSSYYVSGPPTGNLLHRSDRLWYARLFADPDFHQAAIDRWWELRRGPLRASALLDLVAAQAADIGADRALLNGLPSAAEWATRLGRMQDWLSQRAAWIDSQYLRPPAFNQDGGDVPDGFQVVLTGASGTLYFTTDGSDPRAPGGGVAPGAAPWTGPLALHAPTWIKARLQNGNNWSGLASARFSTPQDLTPLAITEIMYRPPDTSDWPSDDLEFLELKNTGPLPLQLDGLTFTRGLDFTFPAHTRLEPGAFFVLVRNATAFRSRYPLAPIQGVFTGRLDNGGETLRLDTPGGQPVLELTYHDRAPWPLAADGHGFSLVPRSPAPANPDYGLDWRASPSLGGSPGADDPPALAVPVVLNELLPHPVPPDLDAVELFNPDPRDADLSGWFLTDDGSAPRKYRFPDGTVVPGGGYLVLTEADFNPAPGSLINFALSAAGESLYLLAADPHGRLTGYSHSLRFGAAPAGQSLGRLVNSTGREFFPLQSQPTLGRANASPAVSPVVLSEIHYHAPQAGDEFIELRNLTLADIELVDPDDPGLAWRLAGLDVPFPPGLRIPASGFLLLVNGDPTGFRTRFFVPAAVPILAAPAALWRSPGAVLALQRPDVPTAPEAPYLTLDSLSYLDRAPWPPAAAGGGASLQRPELTRFGDDPAHWIAAPPTPGSDWVSGEPLAIVAHPVSQSLVPGQSAVLSVAVHPTATLPIQFRWQANGLDLPNATFLLPAHGCFLHLTHPQPPSAAYRVLVANSARPTGVLSREAVLEFLSDADQDGLADAWEAAHGLNPGARADRDLDADGDRVSNYDEYLAGTDPADAGDALRLRADAPEGTANAVLRFHAAAGRTYRLEATDDLGNPSWRAVADFPAQPTPRDLVQTESAPTVARFYRVRTPVPGP